MINIIYLRTLPTANNHKGPSPPPKRATTFSRDTMEPIPSPSKNWRAAKPDRDLGLAVSPCLR